MTVSEIMVREVFTVGVNDTLSLADELMKREHIRHLPVVDHDRVAGVLSQRDLFRSALVDALGCGAKARDTLMRTVRAKEAMSEPALTISPDAPIGDAAVLMIDEKVGCLPVVEKGCLVGLVTETDILRHVADRPLDPCADSPASVLQPAGLSRRGD